MKSFLRPIWIASLCCLSVPASPTSWIYAAPRAIFSLAGTASASASSATPTSFISDLRRKDAKAAQLQELNGDAPAEYDNQGERENNEATPGLLQKKVNKILAKLRLIAQIKRAYQYRPEVHDHDTNITLPAQDETDMINSTVIIQRDAEEPRSQNIQQIPSPLELQEEPLKVDSDVDKFNDKVEVLVTPRTPMTMKNGKLRDEPNRLGALGVFFAELVGSIVGLTYGAFAQITNAGQSPIAASTSEGL